MSLPFTIQQSRTVNLTRPWGDLITVQPNYRTLYGENGLLIQTQSTSTLSGLTTVSLNVFPNRWYLFSLSGYTWGNSTVILWAYSQQKEQKIHIHYAPLPSSSIGRQSVLLYTWQTTQIRVGVMFHPPFASDICFIEQMVSPPVLQELASSTQVESWLKTNRLGNPFVLGLSEIRHPVVQMERTVFRLLPTEPSTHPIVDKSFGVWIQWNNKPRLVSFLPPQRNMEELEQWIMGQQEEIWGPLDYYAIQITNRKNTLYIRPMFLLPSLHLILWSIEQIHPIDTLQQQKQYKGILPHSLTNEGSIVHEAKTDHLPSWVPYKSSSMDPFLSYPYPVLIGGVYEKSISSHPNTFQMSNLNYSTLSTHDITLDGFHIWNGTISNQETITISSFLDSSGQSFEETIECHRIILDCSNSSNHVIPQYGIVCHPNGTLLGILFQSPSSPSSSLNELYMFPDHILLRLFSRMEMIYTTSTSTNIPMLYHPSQWSSFYQRENISPFSFSEWIQHDISLSLHSSFSSIQHDLSFPYYLQSPSEDMGDLLLYGCTLLPPTTTMVENQKMDIIPLHQIWLKWLFYLIPSEWTVILYGYTTNTRNKMSISITTTN